MNGEIFKKLEYKDKKIYLLNLFFDIKDIYPIYKKTYDLLSLNENLNDLALNKIYDAVEEIGKEMERKTIEKTQIRKRQIQEIEQNEQKQAKNDLSEIEKSFT